MSAVGKLVGPFTIDMKVHIENPDQCTIGAVTVGLPVGRVPTLDGIHRAIGQALAALPDGYGLLDAGDFFNKVLVKEKTGRAGNFAVPGNFRFDVDGLVASARAAYTPEPESDEPDDHDDEEWEDDDE